MTSILTQETQKLCSQFWYRNSSSIYRKIGLNGRLPVLLNLISSIQARALAKNPWCLWGWPYWGKQSSLLQWSFQPTGIRMEFSCSIWIGLTWMYILWEYTYSDNEVIYFSYKAWTRPKCSPKPSESRNQTWTTARVSTHGTLSHVCLFVPIHPIHPYVVFLQTDGFPVAMITCLRETPTTWMWITLPLDSLSSEVCNTNHKPTVVVFNFSAAA
jgi:hypothetical protein